MGNGKNLESNVNEETGAQNAVRRGEVYRFARACRREQLGSIRVQFLCGTEV